MKTNLKNNKMDLFYNDIYPDMDDDIKEIIDYDWDSDNYQETPIEELYRMPSNKFIKLVDFSILKDYTDNYLDDEETIHLREQDIILELLNHPFGDSTTIDKAYTGIQMAIDRKENVEVSRCVSRAKESFQTYLTFQRNERSESCPVCLDEACFQDCQKIYRCNICQGAVCADCGPLIPRKCPMCNIQQPLQTLSLDAMTQEEKSTLKPRMSVRQLMYQKMYLPAPNSTNSLFGTNCKINFNMEKLSDSEFDYQIAEFLRHTQDFLYHQKITLEEKDFQQELETKYWWAVDLVPLLNL